MFFSDEDVSNLDLLNEDYGYLLRNGSLHQNTEFLQSRQENGTKNKPEIDRK